jgi:hypothetical protein
LLDHLEVSGPACAGPDVSHLLLVLLAFAHLLAQQRAKLGGAA